jgi:hypothetical protein
VACRYHSFTLLCLVSQGSDRHRPNKRDSIAQVRAAKGQGDLNKFQKRVSLGSALGTGKALAQGDAAILAILLPRAVKIPKSKASLQLSWEKCIRCHHNAHERIKLALKERNLVLGGS